MSVFLHWIVRYFNKKNQDVFLLLNWIMFKRIIYPTDFSESSNRSLSFALDVASSHQSEMIIFYTYRLISSDSGRESMNGVSIKKEQENIAFKKFQKLRKAHPGFAKINYRFVVEVGFADERISSAIKTLDIDLLILPESIQGKLEENFELHKENFATHFHCPVLLVPSLPVDHY